LHRIHLGFPLREMRGSLVRYVSLTPHLVVKSSALSIW
jgi:hypothetical protein